jgi:hypothetical protein
VNNLAGDLRTVESYLPFVAELHDARFKSEERVILADADIVSRHDLGAALAHDDRTGLCLFSVGDLYTEEFRLGVTKVFSCSACFSVCHKSLAFFEVSTATVRGHPRRFAFDMTINIAELWEKGKYWAVYGGHVYDVYITLVLLGVAFGAFACGRLSVIKEYDRPVTIRTEPMNNESHGASSSTAGTEIPREGTEEKSPEAKSPGSVVASRNSDKYHLPWCGGARSIKEENKIWFSSESEAQSAGYTKAGNCK